MAKPKYHGITYDSKRDPDKHRGCKDGIHLLDEVVSAQKPPDNHYLYCDSCGLTVYIRKITVASKDEIRKFSLVPTPTCLPTPNREK